MLNQKSNTITVIVRRIGGGFGGKETNFLTSKGFYHTARDAVNSSIRHINHEEFNWPWNHREEEETLSAGIMRYPYPEDAKMIDENSFRLKKNTTLNISTRKLKSLDYQDYLDR